MQLRHQKFKAHLSLSLSFFSLLSLSSFSLLSLSFFSLLSLKTKQTSTPARRPSSRSTLYDPNNPSFFFFFEGLLKIEERKTRQLTLPVLFSFSLSLARSLFFFSFASLQNKNTAQVLVPGPEDIKSSV